MGTMSREQQIATFSQLGQLLLHFGNAEPWPGYACGLSTDEYQQFDQLIIKHHHSNGWFTESNIRFALRSWGDALSSDKLNHWLASYPLAEKPALQIGIICAGNIPMVGFHDVLSTILSGNRALIKLSSDDGLLIPAVLQLAEKLSPELAHTYQLIPHRMSGFDAVIATGSTNTARYFQYYFRDVPHIIRKSRTSVAILDGTETQDELLELGKDIFNYFGLGCRSISKIYIPEEYELNQFFGAIYPYHEIINHNKYANNYDYNKAVWLLNQENLLDNGFLLLKEEEALASPTASLYYERYSSLDQLKTKLKDHHEMLQCIVGHGYIPFGQAQNPMLWDYADNLDTLQFLGNL